MSDEDITCSQETNNTVKEIVQAIMMLDYSKKPFKQSDIVSMLSQKPGRKNWKIVFDKARQSLDILGLELVETKDSASKSFFLISKHRPLPVMHKYATEEEVSSRILLTLVLTYIFMKNGVVESVDLLNHLKDLKVYNEKSEHHPYFGNVKKKLFSEFVDQLYLSVKKIPESDIIELSWGQRAEVEVTKKSILEFVCQYGYDGKIKPSSLVCHYEKAMEHEKQSPHSESPDVEVM